MRIFLVRHGDADAEIPEGLSDDARALTAKGRQLLLQHFGSLAERLTDVPLIVTSPLVRAVQTAQILSMVLKHDGPLRAHRGLLPDMPVGAIEAIFLENAESDLIVVGHQPSMGALAAHLLGMQSFPKPVNPGTVIGIHRVPVQVPTDETPPPPGAGSKLLFYAPPGQPMLDSV